MACLQAETLRLVREEEKATLEAQSLPLRNYLMKFVMPTLTEGLVEVCKVKPDDPVDYLVSLTGRRGRACVTSAHILVTCCLTWETASPLMRRQCMSNPLHESVCGCSRSISEHCTHVLCIPPPLQAEYLFKRNPQID